MASDPKAMVKEGIRLYKANQKAEARAIWEQVTELDPYNEQAWLWLSAVVESIDDQRVCLENVIFINPDNPNAKKGIAALDAKKAASGGASSGSGAAVGTPSAPQPASPSRPAAPSIPTSSASSAFVPESTPPEVYDDWIGSLNLPNSGKQSSKAEETTADAWTVPDDLPASSPFTTTDFGSLDDGGTFSAFSPSDSPDTSLFDDISDEGDSFEVFTPSNKAPSAPAFTPSDDLRSDDLRALMASDDDDDDDLYSSSPSNTSASSPAFRNFSLDEDEMEDDDDVFGDDFDFTPTASSGSSASSRSSGSSQREEYDLGDDPFSANPFPDSTLPKTNPFTSDTLDFEDRMTFGGSGSAAYGITALGEEADPAEYFAMIPETIKARQLPGSSEKYPFILRLMFILLVLLNIGAVILLVTQLAG